MTIESDLFTRLKTVTPRVFPDFAPVSTVRPYLTFQQIGGNALTFLGTEIPSKQNGFFQVNAWCNTRAEAAALAIAIETAMVTATTFQAKPMAAPASDFDADVPVYGARIDFSIWSNR